VLESRIREQICVDEMQFGFRSGKETTDAIFIETTAGKASGKRKEAALCICGPREGV
jgi:hypothetical protein